MPERGEAEAARRRRALVLLAGLVAVIVAAVHWPALSAGALSFDDNQYLTENPLVQRPSFSAAARFFGEVLEPSTVRGYYQPLAMVSLMLDHALGGRADDLRQFHRTSLALHVSNTVLIVLLLYLLFGEPWAAALAGLLFGVHPLTVEPIPWVGERKTVLTTFFALLALIAYVRYARRPRPGPYLGSLAAYVLALLSKPVSTPLPVLMLLLDAWPLRRLGRRAVLEKAPFFAVAAVSAVVTYVSQSRTASVSTPGQYSPAVVPLTLCHNVVFYLWKVVWPADLSSHYPYPEPFDLSQPMVFAGLAGTCALAALLGLSLRSTRALAVGWLFFFVAIFPTMGVVGFTHVIASDKYAYLPAIGLLLPLARGIGLLLAKAELGGGPRAALRTGLLAILVAVAGAEAAGTRRQLAHWRDTETLFRHMLCLAPGARSLHCSLADALRQKAEAHRARGEVRRAEAVIDEAMEEYRLALQRKLDSPYGHSTLLTCAAHNNLGNLLAARGRVGEAIGHWTEVLGLNPRDFNAHNNLGIALAWRGEGDRAIEHYTEALRLEPNLPETHNNLGVELGRKGRVEAAIGHYRESLRLKPDFVLARKNLGLALAAAGRTEEALGALREACRIRPLDADARCALARLLEQQGRIDEARAEYEEALRVDPRSEAAQWGVRATSPR